jgi:hypothetical protein
VESWRCEVCGLCELLPGGVLNREKKQRHFRRYDQQQGQASSGHPEPTVCRMVRRFSKLWNVAYGPPRLYGHRDYPLVYTIEAGKSPPRTLRAPHDRKWTPRLILSNRFSVQPGCRIVIENRWVAR